MDVTMIGLQNAGKSSLLRVLAVRQYFPISTDKASYYIALYCAVLTEREPGWGIHRRVCIRERLGMPACRFTILSTNTTVSSIPTIGFNTARVQKGHVTLKWSA